MKVNFGDETRTFKSLDGEVLRQNRFEVLVVMKASEIAGEQVLDVKQAAKILENNNEKFSDLFDDSGKPVTLRMICVDVLNSPGKEDKKLDGNERYERFKLAERIHGCEESGEIEITAEKVSLLKKLIAESQYTNVVLGQAYRWLEDDEKVEEEKVAKEKEKAAKKEAKKETEEEAKS